MNNNTDNTNSNTFMNTSIFSFWLQTAFFVSIQLILAYLLGVLDTALLGDALCINLLIIGYFIESIHRREDGNGAITILEIERLLGKRGIKAGHLEEKLLCFQYKLDGLTWNLRFDNASGMVALGFACVMDDQAAADIAIKGGCQVMAGIKQVRFYLKQDRKDTCICLTLETFHDTIKGLDKALDGYFDALVEAMKRHDTACRKIIEEKAPEKRTPRVGYYSEITERVNAFNSTHPETTKEERMELVLGKVYKKKQDSH